VERVSGNPGIVNVHHQIDKSSDSARQTAQHAGLVAARIGSTGSDKKGKFVHKRLNRISAPASQCR